VASATRRDRSRRPRAVNDTTVAGELASPAAGLGAGETRLLRVVLADFGPRSLRPPGRPTLVVRHYPAKAHYGDVPQAP
jgi:hypothetical protein